MNNLSFRGNQIKLLKNPLLTVFLSLRHGRWFDVAVKCNAKDIDANDSKGIIIIILLLTLCYLVIQVVNFC